MPEIDELVKKIEQLFLRYGIKSVTMDDIARELGISKKTLYVHFPNKNSLVKKVMTFHLRHREHECSAIHTASKNAIEEMYEVYLSNCKFFREFNASAIYDLQKYYPSGWELFTNHKDDFIYSMVLDNLQRGIEEGLYRKDFNPDVIAKLYVARIELMMDSRLFPESEFQRNDVMNEFLLYHLRGIASEKGIKYIEQHKIVFQ